MTDKRKWSRRTQKEKNLFSKERIITILSCKKIEMQVIEISPESREDHE